MVAYFVVLSPSIWARQCLLMSLSPISVGGIVKDAHIHPSALCEVVVRLVHAVGTEVSHYRIIPGTKVSELVWFVW